MGYRAIEEGAAHLAAARFPLGQRFSAIARLPFGSMMIEPYRAIRPAVHSRCSNDTRSASTACLIALALATESTTAHADPEVEALAIATGVLAVYAIATPEHQERNALELEVGRLDAVKNDQPATAFGAEYRAAPTLWWMLRPFVGGGFTSEHSFYGYGGLRFSTYWDDRLVATPSFAIGGYSRGHGKDLGSPAVLGRFGIDLEYRLDNDVRVGVSYHHFSNGKALGQSTNTGTEIVGITLSFAL